MVEEDDETKTHARGDTKSLKACTSRNKTPYYAASAACASASQPCSPKRAPPPNTRAAYRLAIQSAPVLYAWSVVSVVFSLNERPTTNMYSH